MYPKNPNQVVIKNKYYPRGLSEIQVWDYYQSVKYQLLQQTRNINISIWIAIDENKLIIKRNIQDKLIQLNSINYDKIITGRTISIHSNMPDYSNEGIIDLDIDDFRKAKEATLNVYRFILEKIPIVIEVNPVFTGKESFHLHLKFDRKLKIDTIRNLLKKYLLESELTKKYTISHKRTKGIVNLDLSSNKLKGNFITPFSLSTIGLRTMILKPNEIMNFQIGRAII